MAHPLNRPRFDAAQPPRRRGLRHPAAARRRQPAGRQPLALRAAVRRRARHRSVHARRLRRLPGPVRRRLVHRQGHLRRRCVRARARRALPREPHPQPRPARRLLRALGPAERRRAVRGVSRRATAPTWRAATAGSAATGRSRAGCCRACPAPDGARRAQSAVAAVALEDLRQPAAQPGAGRADAAAAARLGRAAAALAVDAGGARGPVRPPLLSRVGARPAAQAGRHAAGAQHLRATLRVGRAAQFAQAAVHARAACPTRRSFSLDAIVRTLWRMLVTRRRLLEWTAVEPTARQRDRTGAARRPIRAMWIAPALALATAALLALVAARSAAASQRRSCCCGSRRRRIAWWLSRPLAPRRERV